MVVVAAGRPGTGRGSPDFPKGLDMAKIHGHGGVLKVGAVDIGHLQGWNLDVQANVTEGYSMGDGWSDNCLLYTSPSPRDRTRSRMPSSA